MTRTIENARIVSKQVKRLSAIELLNDTQLSELANEALQRFPTPAAVKGTIDALMREWDGVDNNGSPRAPTPHELGKLAPRRQRSGVGCGNCDGTGFVMRTDRRQTLLGVRDVEIAYFCACHPGRKSAR